jgi:hypothetical protein
VFGIDAGAVRYGCFPRANGGLESRDYQQVALSRSAFAPGLVGCALQEERSFRQGLDELLGRLGEPVTEASVVLPDSWLRIAFAETGELPRSAHQREEIFRWKLRQLVPFRVEDLRLRAFEVEPVAGSSEPRRVMLGFALELLIGQIEAAFSALGIRVGLVSNVSLSLLQAVLEAAGSGGVKAVVSVAQDGYALVFASEGRPVLHRFKASGAESSERATESALRELRLTRSFLDERLSGLGNGPVYLFAPESVESRWTELLATGLEASEIRSGSDFLRWTGRPDEHEVWQVAPLMGAACTMVS